jgi:hypothetical protein
MQKLILAAAAIASLASTTLPVLAQAQDRFAGRGQVAATAIQYRDDRRDFGYDRRDFGYDRRDYRDDRRYFGRHQLRPMVWYDRYGHRHTTWR